MSTTLLTGYPNLYGEGHLITMSGKLYEFGKIPNTPGAKIPLYPVRLSYQVLTGDYIYVRV